MKLPFLFSFKMLNSLPLAPQITQAYRNSMGSFEILHTAIKFFKLLDFLIKRNLILIKQSNLHLVT